MIELVFLHIPKTAGRTLAHHIAGQYPGDAVVTASRAQLSMQRRSLGDLIDENTRVIMGHLFFREVEEFLDRKTRVITFLREPVERILSHYDYIVASEIPRQREEYPLRLIARRMRVVHRSVSGSWPRFLAQLVLHPGQFVEPPTLEDWIELPGSRNRMCRYLEGCPLERLWFVGFQERFADDVRVLASRLRWNAVDPGLMINANPRRKNQVEISPAIERRIEELNVDDFRLYRRAAALWGFNPT